MRLHASARLVAHWCRTPRAALKLMYLMRKDDILPGTPVTWFDLYDCQSLIQLAAGINLALTVGAALRAPYAAAFDVASDKALDQIAWSKSLLAAPRQTPVDKVKIQTATAIAESGEEAVKRSRSNIEGATADWKRSDTFNFGLAVIVSLISIVLLFKSAGAHRTIEVDAIHLNAVIRAKHVSYQVTLLICASLYLPLVISLLGFVRTRVTIRRAEKDVRTEVSEVREAVRAALL